jgi:hypothetical protein
MPQATQELNPAARASALANALNGRPTAYFTALGANVDLARTKSGYYVAVADPSRAAPGVGVTFGHDGKLIDSKVLQPVSPALSVAASVPAGMEANIDRFIVALRMAKERRAA